MKFIYSVLVAFIFCTNISVAAPASEASIKQLMEVTKARSLVDNIYSQVEGSMNSSLQRALQGKTPTPSEQKAINNMKQRMTTLIKEELDWNKLEPMYIRLYKESFTQVEVDGILEFYKTPAGQAVINKMPILMQKTMGEMQGMMGGLMPKLQKIQQEFAAELRATKNK